MMIRCIAAKHGREALLEITHAYFSMYRGFLVFIDESIKAIYTAEYVDSKIYL